MKRTATKKVVRRQGEAVISVTTKSGTGKENAYQRRMVVDDLPEHVAYVKVGGGITKSPKPYESIRMDVSVTLPCHPDTKGQEAAYESASATVEEWLCREYDKMMGEDSEH